MAQHLRAAEQADAILRGEPFTLNPDQMRAYAFLDWHADLRARLGPDFDGTRPVALEPSEADRWSCFGEMLSRLGAHV